MNGIVYRHLKNKTSFTEISTYSFDFSKWPECEARSSLETFYKNTGRGFEYAQAMTSEAHRDYLMTINDRSLPKALELVKDRLEEQVKLYWQDKFAFEVSLNPSRLDALISEYHSKKPSGVKLYKLNEEIGNLTRRQLEKIKSGDALVKIPAFPILSEYIGGFNPSCVTILTAPSGFGKTNLSVSLAQSASEIMPVLYFNMEMDYDNFAARFLHNGANISNEDWRTGSFIGNPNSENNILKFAEERQAKHEIVFTDGKALTVPEIKAAVYSMFDGSSKGLVIVDYDQKILLDRSKDEWRELLYAISEFEEIAKRTRTHWIVLCQGDDEGEIKASKRMRQVATNMLTFGKEKNGISPLIDKYFIKGLKTRYSGDKVVEVGVDLAKSKVYEVGLLELKVGAPKGKYAF